MNARLLTKTGKRAQAASSVTAPRAVLRCGCVRPAAAMLTSATLAATLAWLPAFAHAQTKAPAAPASAQYAVFAKGRIDVAGGMTRLASARDGIITSVHAEEGAEVKRGALLAQLDDRQARLLLEAARNEADEIDARIKPVQVKLAAAERELARVEPLVATQAVARAERDDKRDQVALIRAEADALRAHSAAAQTRIKLATLEVDLRAVRAPVDGRIIKRFARAGDSAQAAASAPLFLFAPKAPLVVRADLEERFLAHAAPGMAAEIVLEADETRVLKGRVARIGQAFGARAPSDDPAERADVRTVDMIVTLDAVNATNATNATSASSAAPPPLIGQRVLVRIAKGAKATGPASK